MGARRRTATLVGVPLVLAALTTAVMPVSAAAPATAGSSLLAPSLAPPATIRDPFCPGFGGLDAMNPRSSVLGGYAKLPPISGTAYRVGSGTNVTWTAGSPNISWRIWLHSLKWTGALVYGATGRYDHVGGGVYRLPSPSQRWSFLNGAAAIVADYLRDNPRVTSSPNVVQRMSMGHRTQLMACLIEGYGSAAPSWLVRAARAHAAYLLKRGSWLGPNNQGLDQDLGVLAVGHVAGPRSYADAAARRIAYTIRLNVDQQGATNEGSVGYAAYQYVLWQRIVDRLQKAGITPPDGAAERIARIPEFLAHATAPDGVLVQLGDTVAKAANVVEGTPIEYAATRGSSGRPPAERVKIYSIAGYVFGRSAWSPFRSASMYSLRYGPTATLHGHYDQTAVTYYAQGRQVLIDAGHIGYADKSARSYLWSHEAHNVLTADQYLGFRPAKNRPALTQQVVAEAYDAFTIADAPYYSRVATNRVPRTRSVLVARGPDVLVIHDRASNAPSSVTWRQHFHLPAGSSLTVQSRDRMTATAAGGRTTFVRVPLAGTPAVRGAVRAASFQAFDIGRRRATLDAQFTGVGRGVDWLTVVVPAPAGTPVSVSGAVPQPDGSRLVSVDVGGAVVTVSIAADGTLSRV